MIKKDETQKTLFLRKKIIKDKNYSKYLSFSNTNKEVSTNQSNISNSLNKKSLIKKKNLKSNTIQINYKGFKEKIGKMAYYKIKNLDINDLIFQREEKLELIKQTKQLQEKKDKIYNVEIMDLKFKLREKECRKEIAKIQKKMLNINELKEEIYRYYEIILIIIKNIEKNIDSEYVERKNKIENNINFYINKLDTNFINKFNEIGGFFHYLSDKLKELIEKMNILSKDYDEIKLRIKSINNENIHLKKKINEINIINYNLYKKISSIKKKKKENIDDKNHHSIFYKKLQNNLTKRYIERAKKSKQRITQNNICLHNENTNQTFFTSNNINLLTDKSNIKENLLSLSNNFFSSSSLSNSSNGKEDEKINLREMNYIIKLKNKIKILKTKIRQMKTKENLPKNAFYDLINQIMEKIKKEESDIIIDGINYQFLNENMKIFPYQSDEIRKRFRDYLFFDPSLYKIFNSKRQQGINYFKFSIFNKEKN